MRKIFNFQFSIFNFHKGFTLIELLIVMIIVTTLATLITTNLRDSLVISRDAKRKHDLAQIQRALEGYYNDNNRYPASLPSGGSPFMPYIAKIPQDLRHDRQYVYESEGGSWYRLYAKLERCSDSQIIEGIDCNTAQYNYSVTSSNLSVIGFGEPTPTPLPTSTPIPLPTQPPQPTSTPTPTPTPTPIP